ncbi:MAG TPA: glycosyltransferase family 39 protein [bacterium]|nr:glycosyltransferase family 39 protein [bacterium]
MKRKSKTSRKSKNPFIQILLPSTSSINWLYCLLGALTAFWGAQQWTGSRPHWLAGLPFEVVSILLIWNAFPPKIGLEAEKEKPRRSLKSSARHPFPSWLLLLLFPPAALGQYFLFSGQLAKGFLAWAVALGLAAFIKTKTPEGPAPSSHRLERVGLILVLLAASLMRFPFVGQHMGGFQIDEANNMIGSFGVISGSFQSPFAFGWSGNQSLPFFLYAYVLKAFGETVSVARAFSAVLSIAALFFFYSWCRMFSSVKASLVSTFLLSASWWCLFYSLSPFHNMLVTLFEILSFYLLERCLRRGLRSDFALLGVCMAFGFLGYLPGRLIPVMIFLVVVVFAAQNPEKFLKTYLQPFVQTLLFFLLVAAPFFMFAWDDLGEFFGRSKELSLMNEVHRTGNYGLIAKRLFWTFTSFSNPAQTFDERFDMHNNPLLDPLTSLLFYFGLLLAFLNLGKRWSHQALIGLALGFSANAFAIQGPNPDTTYINAMRFFLTIPFPFLMGAQAIDWFSGLWTLPRKKAWILPAVLAGAMVFSFAWNARLFYDKFHHSMTGWAYMGFNHIRVAETMNENSPRCAIILDSDFDSSTVQVLTHNRTPYTAVKSLPLPLPYKADKDVLVIFRPGNFDETKLRQTYPNAVWKDVKDEWNGVIVKTVEITPAEIESRQKGITPVPLP